MPLERHELIPQPLKGEMKVEIILPEPAIRLMQDLHADRQGIAAGGVLLLACVVALTVKHLFREGGKS